VRHIINSQTLNPLLSSKFLGLLYIIDRHPPPNFSPSSANPRRSKCQVDASCLYLVARPDSALWCRVIYAVSPLLAMTEDTVYQPSQIFHGSRTSCVSSIIVIVSVERVVTVIDQSICHSTKFLQQPLQGQIKTCCASLLGALRWNMAE
jgi:hypothetical protein